MWSDVGAPRPVHRSVVRQDEVVGGKTAARDIAERQRVAAAEIDDRVAADLRRARKHIHERADAWKCSKDLVLAPGARREAENRVRAIARQVDEAIVAGPSIEEIHSGPAIEAVGARASEQPVVARAASQRVAEVR